MLLLHGGLSSLVAIGANYHDDGASHAVPMDRPAEVTRIILDFLDDDVPPTTLLPLRRRA